MPPKRARSITKVIQSSVKKPRLSNAPIVREVRPRKTVEGIVLTCGQGDTGQLGLGPDVMEKKRLAVVPGLSKVVDISAGGMHTVCLTSDGSVYSFGCDDEGALGRQASDDDAPVPGKVQLEKPAVQISAGDSHSAALLEDGRVFAWGCFKDSHGKMGLTGCNESSKKPIHIPIDDAVEKIASGADHLLLLTVKGQLYSCGCPEQGQLGRVAGRFASRDSVRKGMDAFLLPQLIPSRQKLVFTDIWASTYGTFARERSNVMYCSGLNNFHQLLAATEKLDGPVWNFRKNGTLNNKEWVKVTGGDHHTLLLDKDGKVFCLGRREYGRLGLGEQAGDAIEVTPVPGLADRKCVDIACGSAVSFAVTDDGQVFGWGMGSNLQLSSGDDEDDVWTPQILKAKALENRKVLLADAGGQHTVLLVTP